MTGADASPIGSWSSTVIIDVTYDSSVASAPAGFTAAISYVVNFLEATFTNPVTINIAVGWGEIDGQTVPSSYLGESLENTAPAYTYSQVRSALLANAVSQTAMAAASTLPTTDPTDGGNFDLGTADAKALGLYGASSAIDGWVGFYSAPGTFTFDPNDRAVAGEYDFIGIALHEFTEVMGRDADLGYGAYPDSYTALDLFRYSAPGVRDLTAGGRHSEAYFSIDGGNTNLDNFNTDPDGDFGDWADSAGNDSFLAFSNSGVENAFTTTDLTVMQAIGWNATDLYTNEATVVYDAVLFRAPDTVGLYAWAAQIATGQMTPPQLVSDFVSSQEAATIVEPVIRLYDGLFGRAPDVSGLQNWITAEDAGTSFYAVVQGFVGSGEFTNDYGTVNSTDETQFVTALYQHFLGRAPDAGGLSYWLGVLGTTPTIASDAAVVLGFVNSGEFVNDVEAAVNNWLVNAATSALAGTTGTTLGTPTYATSLGDSPNAAIAGTPSSSDVATNATPSDLADPVGTVSKSAATDSVQTAPDGAKTYLFLQPASGNDVISNFDVASDHIDISASNFPQVSLTGLLADATLANDSTILHIGPAQEITLLGVNSPAAIAHDIVIA